MVEQKHEDMSSEKMDMSKLYEDSFKDVKEGEIVKGRVIEVTHKDVVVDVGYKSEGVISLDEFIDPASMKIGDEIDVLIESKENDEGMVVLSKRKAERMQVWEKIIAERKEGDMVTGRVTKKVKGGLTKILATKVSGLFF